MKQRGAKIIQQFENKISSAISRSGVKKVVVGVSGGADSTALLVALCRLGVKAVAVHCNFHLRGEESNRDQAYVEELCSRLGVELLIEDFDVDGYISLNPKTSVEMACRDLRYELFRRLKSEGGYDRIAVAHNSDDNVETLLLNLFRGSGVSGLRGMLPDTGEIIRPLLELSRKDIEAYLSERGESFMIDSTNQCSDYRRNFIRNEVLPLVESRWKGAKNAINTTIENLRSSENVLKWSEEQLIPKTDRLLFTEIESSPDRFWTLYHFAHRYGADRDIVLEMLDVYEKKAGTQLIVGKSWLLGDKGKLRYTMRDLRFEKNCQKFCQSK